MTTDPFEGRIQPLDTPASVSVPAPPSTLPPDAQAWARALSDVVISGRRELARLVQILGRYRLVIGPRADREAQDPIGSGILWLEEDTNEFWFDPPLQVGDTGYDWIGIASNRALAGGRLHDAIGRYATYDNLVAGGVDVAQVFADMADPTGFLSTDTTTISFDPFSRYFTIDSYPLGGQNWSYYVAGKKITIAGPKSYQIPDTEGEHLLALDANGDWVHGTTFDIDTYIRDNAFVAFIRWDATNQALVLLGDERHGLMPHSVHSLWHAAKGSLLTGGGTISSITADGDGSSDSHATYTADNTTFRDEDLFFDHGPLPSTALPVFKKSGNPYTWRLNSNGPVELSGGQPIYNAESGGTWSDALVPNNQFFLMHLFVINDRTNQFGIVMGENAYLTKTAAREGANVEAANLVTGGLPTAEFVLLASFIYQYKSTFANSYKAAIVSTDTGDDYVSWINQEITPGSPPSDHSFLTGRDTVNSHPADAISTDTTGFSGKLSAADDEVQAALDTLDAHLHDDRYYTEAEIDAIVAALSPVGHTHDDRYYTESETDGLLSAKADSTDLAGYLKLDASNGPVTGDLTVQRSGNAEIGVDATGSARLAADRGNSSSEAALDFRTAGTNAWRAGMAAGGTAFLIGPTLGSPAISIDPSALTLSLRDRALRDALGVHMSDTFLSDVSGVPSTWPETVRTYTCNTSTTGAPNTNYGVLIHIGSERGGSGRWNSQIWIDLTGPFPGRLYTRIASGSDTWYQWELAQSARWLQGRFVQDHSPADGEVLTWVNANSQWEPQPAPGSVPALTAGPVATSGVAVTSSTYVTLMNQTPSAGECIVVNRVTTSSSMSSAYNMTIKVTIGGTVVWEQAIWAGSGYGSDFVGPDAVDYPDYIQGGDGQSVKIEAKKTGTNNATLFCEYQKEAC